ncbi:hypothetical protein ACS0TY_006877 [Phlomoides rotata]
MIWENKLIGTENTRETTVWKKFFGEERSTMKKRPTEEKDKHYSVPTGFSEVVNRKINRIM